MKGKINNDMGITRKRIKVINPENPKLFVEENFLIDCGATYTVLKKEIHKKLKLKPEFEQEFSLADGRIIKRKIANVLIEIEGKKVANPVVLGEKGDENLLGVFTLKSAGFVIDPFKREIYKAKLYL